MLIGQAVRLGVLRVWSATIAAYGALIAGGAWTPHDFLPHAFVMHKCCSWIVLRPPGIRSVMVVRLVFGGRHSFAFGYAYCVVASLSCAHFDIVLAVMGGFVVCRFRGGRSRYRGTGPTDLASVPILSASSHVLLMGGRLQPI